MFDWLKTAITSTPFITVITGVIVYVLTEDFKEYVIEPRRSYKKLQGRIAYLLTYYHFYLMNPLNTNINNGKLEEGYIEASTELMKCAAEVMKYSQIRPRFIAGVPSVFKLQEAHYRLVGLSQGCFSENKNETRTKNQKNLKYLRTLLNISRTDSQKANEVY